MYCYNCGKAVPAGAASCPACGVVVLQPPPTRSGAAPGPVEGAVTDLRRAAKELAGAAQRLSDRVAAEAEQAAKDPAASARRITRRVADDVQHLAQDVDRLLEKL